MILPASGDTYISAELKFATNIPVAQLHTMLNIVLFFSFLQAGHKNTCASSSENQPFFTKAGHCVVDKYIVDIYYIHSRCGRVIRDHVWEAKTRCNF